MSIRRFFSCTSLSVAFNSVYIWRLYLHLLHVTSLNYCYQNITDQEIALSKYTSYRKGEIRTQICLTAVPTVFTAPHIRNNLFSYTIKKKNPRRKITRLRYAGNQFPEIKGNCHHSKMQYFEGALKHSYLREHMAASSSPGFSQ